MLLVKTDSKQTTVQTLKNSLKSARLQNFYSAMENSI